MPSDDEVDRLYGLAPSEFVAARDALAKQLKAEGDTEGAKAVKALRRPTAAAWAVNRLVRDHADDVAALLDLGERLRRAQARALRGDGAGTLKELLAERRSTVERLTRLAGLDAPRDAIVATLEAALADADAAAMVAAGRLAKELPPPSGFGAPATAPDDDDGGGALDDGGAHKDGEEVARRRAQHDVDEKRGALRQAVDDAGKATREHDDAFDEQQRLEERLAAVKERVERAAERRRLADRRAGEAADALEEAERALRDMSVEYRRSDAQE